MLRVTPYAALLAALLVASVATADISVITAPPDDPNRSIAAAVTGHPGDGESTSAAGFWSESATSAGSTAAGSFTADAGQVSSIPDTVGAAIFGAGSASVSVMATGATGYSILADSTLIVFFEVTEERVYEFQGDVSWIGTLPEFSSGFTTAALRDDTNNLSIHFADADEFDPGEAFDIFTTLSPGIVYELKVRAHVSGGSALPGEHFPSASYSFTLHPVVPEPATCGLLALAALVGLARLRRR